MKFYWFFKCLFGFGTIYDGSICWFSSKFFDIHDYAVDKGGTSYPWHMYVYKCPECKKHFMI